MGGKAAEGFDGPPGRLEDIRWGEPSTVDDSELLLLDE